MIRRPPRSTLFPYTDALPICEGAGLIHIYPGGDRRADSYGGVAVRYLHVGSAPFVAPVICIMEKIPGLGDRRYGRAFYGCDVPEDFDGDGPARSRRFLCPHLVDFPYEHYVLSAPD